MRRGNRVCRECAFSYPFVSFAKMWVVGELFSVYYFHVGLYCVFCRFPLFMWFLSVAIATFMYVQVIVGMCWNCCFCWPVVASIFDVCVRFLEFVSECACVWMAYSNGYQHGGSIALVIWKRCFLWIRCCLSFSPISTYSPVAFFHIPCAFMCFSRCTRCCWSVLYRGWINACIAKYFFANA